MAITLSVAHLDDVLVLAPQGQLLEVADGEPLLFEVENHEATTQMVVDCSKIQHLNSTGINALLKVFTQVRNGGGELVLCALPSSIEKLLVITKLTSIFNIYPNVEEAVSYFKSRKS